MTTPALGEEHELPFGAKEVDDLVLPFCACGRLHSECDGSRRACRKLPTTRRVGEEGGG